MPNTDPRPNVALEPPAVPRQDMEKQKISYAQVLERTLKFNVRHLDICGSWDGVDRCDCGLTHDIEAVRALAGLVERAERLSQIVAPDADILSTDERPSFEEWDAIVRLLAAGFSTAPNAGFPPSTSGAKHNE